MMMLAFNKSGAGFGGHGGDGLDNFLLWSKPPKNQPRSVSPQICSSCIYLTIVFDFSPMCLFKFPGLKTRECNKDDKYEVCCTFYIVQTFIFLYLRNNNISPFIQIPLSNQFLHFAGFPPDKTFPIWLFPTHFQFIMLAVNHLKTSTYISKRGKVQKWESLV